MIIQRWGITLAALVLGAVQGAENEVGKPLPFESIPRVEMKLTGPVGDRVQANIDRWLLEAPLANPGMLEMFRVRDREPVPQIVPWAGEFVGKYLISGIQALRMSDDPRLEPFLTQVVHDLISTQAEDGYMGPFRKNERLLGQWDLWGHYHIMHALLMWHEYTGDARALEACRRMGDLVCATFLNTNRRVYDAGSHEMNMGIITSLGWLHRVTGEPKYLAMAQEVLKDFERAGDYYRAGLARTPFYLTPKPRWESLHSIQGLVELYRISGDPTMKESFKNTWLSILTCDERNTGGFSSGEQATGNPYEDTPIETCCTIAWNALTVDALKLTGEGQVADTLEKSFYNGVLGAQHPSGRWWTYNTPMNGIREASAHTIVFQSRAGTPELNCCSVNAPRGLGMLSEWGVLKHAEGWVINYLGPMSASIPLGDGSIEIETQSRYPLDGAITISVRNRSPRATKVFIRIPKWSKATADDGSSLSRPANGYIARDVKANGEEVFKATLELPIWWANGYMEQAGNASIYRGPLLLAYDQALNPFDPGHIPSLDIQRIHSAGLVDLPKESIPWKTSPWLVMDLPAREGTVKVCDFASAGSAGTPYRTWLAADHLPPPLPLVLEPKSNARVAPGPMVVVWRRPPVGQFTYTVTVRDLVTKELMIEQPGLAGPRAVLPSEATSLLKPGVDYELDVIALGPLGENISLFFPHRFQVDPSLPPLSASDLTEFGERADGCLIDAPLTKDAKPTYGTVESSEGIVPVDDGPAPGRGSLKFEGNRSRLTYKLKRFPDDYTLLIQAKVTALPTRLTQIASAWCKGGDDPLRLCLDGGKLFTRIEGAGGASTAGVPMPVGEWVHLGVVKHGGELTLWSNGAAVARASAPKRLMSSSTILGIGRNPLYGGDESLEGELAGLQFFARAFSKEEMEKEMNSASK